MLNVPITPPRVAFLDQRTGNVSREWYMFFLSLFQLTGSSGVSLDELQKGPPPASIHDVLALTPEDVQSDPGTLEQIAELNKRLQDMMQAPQPQSPGEPIARYQRTLSWLTIAH